MENYKKDILWKNIPPGKFNLYTAHPKDDADPSGTEGDEHHKVDGDTGEVEDEENQGDGMWDGGTDYNHEYASTLQRTPDT